MFPAVQSIRVWRAGPCLVSPVLAIIASVICKISTLNCCRAFEQRGFGRAESGEVPVRIHSRELQEEEKAAFEVN